MLITSATPIFVMIISIIFLKRAYGWVHLVGATIVVVGIALINYSKFTEAPVFVWQGTLLAVCASLGYAISGVVQEHILRAEHDHYPFAALFAMGLVGSIVSSIIANFTHIGMVDRDSILLSTDPRKFYAIGFVAALSLFHLLIPVYIKRYTTVVYNISLVTSDIYVYLYSLLFVQSSLSAVYYGGFLCILLGLVVFNVGGLFGVKDTKRILDPETL